MSLVPNRGVTRVGNKMVVASGGLRRLFTKQTVGFDVPGQNAGWHGRGGLRSGLFSPRQIRDYLATYGGSDESVVWVYACVSLIAAEGASYPYELLRPDGEILADNEVPDDLRTLLDQPNVRMTYFDFAEFVYTDLELAGNSYWLKDNMTRDGRPERLMRLRPDLVELAIDRATDEVLGYWYTVGSVRVPFDLAEVMHFKYPAPIEGDKYGMGTVEAIQRVLGLELEETDHIAGFYRGGARLSGILSTQELLGEDEWLRLKQDFEQEFGVSGANRFGILIAEKGLSYTPVNVAPAGSGVIELRQMGKDEILSAFGVPEFLLGGSGQGGVYRMSEAQFIFGRNMKPKATRFQERMEQDLVLPGWQLNFQVDPRYAEPPDTKIERAAAMLGKGASLNQVLDAQDLPPIDDPRADEPLLQLGVMPWSLAMRQTEAQIQTAEQAAQGGGIGGIGGSAATDAGFYSGLDGNTTSMNGGGTQPPDATGAPAATGYEGSFYSGLSAPPPMLQSPRPRSRHPQAPRLLGRSEGRKALTVGSGDTAPEAVEMPSGFELRGESKAKHTGQEIADAVVRHQAKVYRDNVDVVQKAMRQFFIEQRKRIIRNLQRRGITKTVVLHVEGKQERVPKPQIQIDKLWPENVEDAALLQTYMPLVDDVAAQAANVGRVAGSGLRWDLTNPLVKQVRALLAQKITRINETTRERVAEVVELGMQRGYSIPQIANGFPDERYPGVMGVFDQASDARAETIARTETAMIYNTAAVAAYQAGGVEHVEVLDGQGDPECAAANGQRWTLEQAADKPIAHPNCVRSFAPIVGGKRPQTLDLKALFDTGTRSTTGSPIIRNVRPFQETETFGRAWKSESYLGDFSYGDRMMSDLAHEYGFDQPPEVLTKDALDVYARNGEQEIYLAFGSPEAVEELLSGEPTYAVGSTGNGIPAAKRLREAREIAGENGIVARATIKRHAEVADLAVVERVSHDEGVALWDAVAAGDRKAVALSTVARDPGRWAITHGYDVLYNDRHDAYVVLNLSALRVQKELIPLAGP